MSPHAPPHLKAIAPILLAGEDVLYMSKPDLKLLMMLEAIVAAGAFVALWLVIQIFSDLPIGAKTAISATAAVVAIAILHLFFGLQTYVVTDQRLIVVAAFTNEAHDSCDLHDIVGFTSPRFSNSLIVERKNGQPIRLWAVAQREELERLLLSARQEPQGPDEPEEPQELA